MSIIKPHLKDIAKDFWGQIKSDITYPCDVFGAVNIILPIDIVCLSNLSLEVIKEWLHKRNVYLDLAINNRALHGFIVTNKGSGIIFINGTDNENERRFTIAHEISHYILDYKLIRDSATKKFGKKILEVLDGERPASLDEQIHGLLKSIQVCPFTHILEKEGDGSFENIKAFNAENDADDLAIELLAPYSKVITDVQNGRKKLPFDEFKRRSYKILITKYKLPESVANSYALKLAYKITGGPSIMNKLGF